MSKKLQVSELADVATKGGAVGVASYLLSTWNIDRCCVYGRVQREGQRSAIRLGCVLRGCS